MKITGHCYCGDLQYEAQGDPIMALQCHCRECQYFTGGNPNASIAMPLDGFRYTSGQPAQFTRTDLDQPVTRDFCGRCGTPLASRAPGLATAIILKVGAMDDPAVYEPAIAIYTCDKQPFHHIPEGLPAFDKVPG